MRTLILALLFCTILTSAYTANAQNINYKFSQRTETYVPLTGGTPCLNIPHYPNDSIDMGFKVAIGVQSPLHDTLYLSRNGMFQTTTSGGSFFYTQMFLLGGAATYKTTGTAGSSLLTVDFANMGLAGSDYINMQLRIFENGIIEMHFGDCSVKDPLSYGSNKGAAIGVPRLYLLGNAGNPSTDTTNKLKYLTGTPTNGTVYRFAPEGVDVSTIKHPKTIVPYPNPGNGLIYFNTAEQGKQTVSVYNVVQQHIAEAIIDMQNNTVDISSQPNGVYIISITDEQGQKEHITYLKQ